MIQQSTGDLLEVREEGRVYYIVVLTQVVMFGGNIVFAFHNDGEERSIASLVASHPGFNICTDLILPKREGRIKRLHRLEDVDRFWRTRLIKASHEHRPGMKAQEWFLYRAENPGGNHFARVRKLKPLFREAMDSGCHPFAMVADKVLARYTPDQNSHI